MADWTVRARGTDSSGRTIWASDYMWAWWQRVVDELGFTPTIVQGAWMVKNGGGANASQGYHDGGGCFDLRIWDLNNRQADTVIRTLRSLGAAAWVRDSRHGGMDPHIHFVLGSDHDLDTGAAYQWQQYLNGRDGLASNGPDYHWRPDPLVTKPPEDEMSPEDWVRMREQFDRIDRAVKAADEASKRRDKALRENVVKPFIELVVEAIPDQATKAQVKRQADKVIAALEDQP